MVLTIEVCLVAI